MDSVEKALTILRHRYGSGPSAGDRRSVPAGDHDREVQAKARAIVDLGERVVAHGYPGRRGRRTSQESSFAEHGRPGGRPRSRPAAGSAPASSSARTICGSFLNTAPASGVWPRSLARPGSAPALEQGATVSAWPW